MTKNLDLLLSLRNTVIKTQHRQCCRGRGAGNWAWRWPTSVRAGTTETSRVRGSPFAHRCWPWAASMSPMMWPSASSQPRREQFEAARLRANPCIYRDQVAQPDGEEGDLKALRWTSPRSSRRGPGRSSRSWASRCPRGSHGHRLPAGLVLTGGGALLAGTAHLGREVLGIPVRVASPTGIGGLTDGLLTPSYATSMGLLLWAARVVTQHEPQRYESAPSGRLLGKAREWLRTLFP